MKMNQWKLACQVRLSLCAPAYVDCRPVAAVPGDRAIGPVTVTPLEQVRETHEV